MANDGAIINMSCSPEIFITPLGAGQDVGRSCILLTIGGKNIMLDCGMHMGFNDSRRFPDFTYINKNGPLTDHLDCVIISHFHLDHCGALPYMSEMVGYDGPIYMTHPTKAICPVLLEDYRKITVERKGELNFFTSEMIKMCMKKVVVVNLHEIISVDDDLKIKAYYAGHVLGAAMFHIKVGELSVVYTGDYNMTPDRHLGAARIDKCRPNVLITESTYATTIRDSKRCRERDFLKKIHSTIERGGKVLIPVFALGRAQELCILLETYWDQKNLKTPIYFSLGLTDKATNFYKLFITWTNEKIKNAFVERNMFDFKHIMPFDRKYIDLPDPMVVFATPGMLHGGLSLQIFKKWCTNENNMIIMPGYCVSGTLGWKLLNGQKKIELENRQILDVKMSVQYMSFSAHADAKGIMQLIKQCCPENVVLVHGEAGKMEFLTKKINKEFGIQCFMPANGKRLRLKVYSDLQFDVPNSFIDKIFAKNSNDKDSLVKNNKWSSVEAALIFNENSVKLVGMNEVSRELGLPEYRIRTVHTIDVDSNNVPLQDLEKLLLEFLKLEYKVFTSSPGNIRIGNAVFIKIVNVLDKFKKVSSKQLTISFDTKNDHIGMPLLNQLTEKFGYPDEVIPNAFPRTT
ncbi:hypothetical protein HELRODRAFT_103064 [Helobdella robusta]|uniref:Integrator complex subunit 11 n=1 Tax=Helobdella robusta TaxID=6412 RepID=T1EDE0_HELRO|nr:hypothetical protein HELRODRAFT_103064 [Helobdella robusta]ESN94141.1 hypothetical protein HELRODRAFT_103064 [Helobdella robusta]